MVNGCEVKNGKLHVNLQAIIQDFEIIGQSLVTSIDISN